MKKNDISIYERHTVVQNDHTVKKILMLTANFQKKIMLFKQMVSMTIFNTSIHVGNDSHQQFCTCCVMGAERKYNTPSFLAVNYAICMQASSCSNQQTIAGHLSNQSLKKRISLIISN